MLPASWERNRGRSKKSPAAKAGGAAGRQRLALIVFGAVFVLLFVGFAVAEGIGQPSVPSGDVAVVKSVPAEIGQISEAEYKVALAQQVAGGEQKKVPKPGSKEAKEMKEAVMVQLVQSVWIQGEAEELSISVTAKQIETELAQIKKSNWPTPAAYKEFLETSKLTQEEVNEKVKVQLLVKKIQEFVAASAPPPSNAEIAASYEENKATTYTTKPSRDVRLIINEDKAEVEAALKKLEADDSAASWKAVAKKYSSDPSTSAKGGLQTGLTEELLQTAGPLKGAIFGAATGEVNGPVKFQKNYVVFEVEKLNPEKVQTLGEVRAQISAQLAEQAKQKIPHRIHRRLRKQVDLADHLRLGLRDRPMRQLPVGRPDRERTRNVQIVLRSEPENGADRMPGAGDPEQTGDPRQRLGAETGR